jgi:type I restriction enzyme S subunit
MADWEQVPAGSVVTQRKDRVTLQPGIEYRTMGVRWYGKGAYDRGAVTTETVKAKSLFRAHPGDFVFNRIDTQNGAFDVVSPDLDGALATNEFPLYITDPSRLLAPFLLLYFQQESVRAAIDRTRAGSEGRARWKEADFEAWQIPLPPLAEQRRIIDLVASVDAQVAALTDESGGLAVMLRSRRAGLIDDESVPTVKAEEAFEFSTGVRRTPDRATGWSMTRYLRSANVGYGTLDLSDVQEMNYEAHEREKFGLQYGDVLVSEGSASAKAVGMPAMWRDDLPAPVCFQMTLLRLRAISAVCTPEYAFHWCLWAYESGAFLDVASGTNIKHISAKRSSQMPVRLPALERQRQVTDELDATTAQLSSLRAELDHVRSFRSTLLTSLLSQEIEIPATYDQILEGVA